MRLRSLACVWLCLGWLVACSGQTTTNPTSNGGSGGTAETGGSGGSGGPAACPDDLETRNGTACTDVAPGCSTGACVHANGVWLCAPACPCADGWSCAWLGDRNGCVPEALAACVPAPDGGTGGVGGSGGTGASGSGGTGYGGTSGSGGTGFGGSTGTGGMGGTGAGGTGPCGGNPACYGTEASFCSQDGTTLLSCQPADTCPTTTSCDAFCATCSCHMAPPVNGVLRGTCDTCASDADCPGNQHCLENPMFPGSGAKTCVAP